MEVILDCLPCSLRQVLEASRMSTDDKKVQEKIMDEAIGVLSRYKSFRNSPDLGRDMHRIVKAHTGISDPYHQIKKRDIRTALSVYPKIKQFVDGSSDRLYWALKAAATGNILDSAINLNIENGVEDELKRPFAVCDESVLKRQLKTAKSLLVIGDNAGETVLDCLLLEQFPDLDRIYAVRSAPVINDATIEDAQASGIGRYARIVSTGCDVPGVLLEECSEMFLEMFYQADIVISKGQGNYETLSDCDRDIYFLLKAKCPVLSRLLGVGINEYVFEYIQCDFTQAAKQSAEDR